MEGQRLVGPWRAEGTTRGVPFRLLTGELGADRTMAVKLAGGGDTAPRFEVDGRLALDQGADGTTIPNIAGRAKLLFGPPAQADAAGATIPVTVEAAFKASGSTVELDPVTLEAGEGGSSMRLAGTGIVRLDEPRLALKLDGRRLDVDSLLASTDWRELLTRLRAAAPSDSVVPIDLDLAFASIGLAQEELTNVTVKASLDRGQVALERLNLTAPGDTKVTLSGDMNVAGTGGGLSGRVAITSAVSNRAARMLDRLGVRSPFLTVLDGKPFEGSAEVTVALPVTSFRNVRVKAGDATLTGNARLTEPEAGGRGRLEAQVAVQGLDLDQLPRVSSLFDATQNLDVGFILDARDVRAGNRRGAGRISARIASDGPTLVVETLDIADLAGANARVNGRIARDGSGRIAGKVTAPRAAPLVDLLGSVWVGGVAKLVPPFLREGALDLDIVTERAPPQPGAPELRLRTTARGRAAGGGFEGEVVTVDGLTQRLDVKLTTENTGRWIDRADVAALRRPSQMTISGTRVGSGRFSLTGSGEIGGVRVTTSEPFSLSAEDDVIDSGAAEIAGADLTPFVALLGAGAGVQGPVPVQARLSLGQDGEARLLTVSGRLANEDVQARLVLRSLSNVSGSVILDRLSLPWLLTTVALTTPVDPGPLAVWSTARFGSGQRPLNGGQTSFRVRRLELGRGLAAENAAFTLTASPDRIAIQDFDAGLGGGRLSGLFAVTRQGALASLVAEGAWRDVPIERPCGLVTASGKALRGAQGRRLRGNRGRADRQPGRRRRGASHRRAGPGSGPAGGRSGAPASPRGGRSPCAPPHRDGGGRGTGSCASYGSVGVLRGVRRRGRRPIVAGLDRLELRLLAGCRRIRPQEPDPRCPRDARLEGEPAAQLDGLGALHRSRLARSPYGSRPGNRHWPARQRPRGRRASARTRKDRDVRERRQRGEAAPAAPRHGPPKRTGSPRRRRGRPAGAPARGGRAARAGGGRTRAAGGGTAGGPRTGRARESRLRTAGS